VDSTEFAELLEGLRSEDISLVADGLRADLASTEGEVAWWRATIAVSGALRRTRRTREAGVAAHRAACAVLTAARQAGLGEDRRTEVSQVARAAAEVARALVAGDVAEPAGSPLLHAWEPVVGAAVAAA
jgi:hypothetical protein